jgi:hypothetical protein
MAITLRSMIQWLDGDDHRCGRTSGNRIAIMSGECAAVTGEAM